jgi:hypothetical protein
MSQIFTSSEFSGVIEEAVNFHVATPVHSLPPESRFLGAGVYAIYYVGDFEHYSILAKATEANWQTPIYIGKAVPSGWRASRANADANEPKLWQRLREHAGSVTAAGNLDIDDFRCRYMVLRGLEADLISAVEAALIRRYTPLWNCTADGFGNHTPGEGRFDQSKSEWDVLHPGREWANRCRGVPPTEDSIVRKIQAAFRGLT